MTHSNCPRCGGRLARDNDSGRCTPCQAAERDRLSAPPTVPASFWEHEPLRQALVDRHLGRVIRAYRCHPYHGRVALPQTVVAGWLGITQAQLSRVENGPALVHLDRLAHWAQLIGIPASCLWFSLPGQTRQSVEKVETTHDSTDLKDAGPDEGRRALLAGIAAVAAGAGLLGGSELVQPRRIGTADIARLNAVLELYRSVDRESGGGLLYREVARFAESVYRMLDWSHPAGLTSPLIAAVATARQFAGWTALDAGRHADAQRHFVAGERAALAAQDVPLVAMIRYAQAKQLQHLRHNRDALATLQLTHAQLGSHATPATKALLWGAEAASIAALGDHQTAVTTLGKASDQFERINKEQEPGRMGFYDRGELLAQYGRVYRDMARRDARHAAEAVRWGRDSIAAFGAGNVRSTVLNEVGMCSALFLADEPEQAIEIGNRLLEKSQVMSSKRVIDRVINLRRDLARHRELPEVAAFDRVLTARAAAA
ncbi:XRE family transcriptional regulator [Micromonospora ureilytica]|uniref:helix-turn-helix domain-containing protein n=1 Tax=Micromonospora ureilytica TaxID=709868 RepID=UPI002E16758F|nr:XRE family transcriptional regulator [Micromonospora ureilytica]